MFPKFVCFSNKSKVKKSLMRKNFFSLKSSKPVNQSNLWQLLQKARKLKCFEIVSEDLLFSLNDNQKPFDPKLKVI